MSIASLKVKSLFFVLIMGLAHSAYADKYRCDDGSIISGGDCPDGGISHIIVDDVKPFQAEAVKPVQAEQIITGQQKRGKLQNSPKKSSDSESEWAYVCADGRVQDTNDCPNGEMGHLRARGSFVAKQHDPKRPSRIALTEFMGNWNTWVPGSTYSTEDRVNDVRVNHVSPGSASHRDLVINPNGTYVWKGIRGVWRETKDNGNPIMLYRAVDGHNWQVSILENWYGFLAISDVTNTGIYYYGKR